MNSFEEMARLKNLVAEKVKVIGMMEKERGAMSKLHKQYQKERLDQDGMEGEYGERMRRVNEDLRVAKGLVFLFSRLTPLEFPFFHLVSSRL